MAVKITNNLNISKNDHLNIYINPHNMGIRYEVCGLSIININEGLYRDV